MERCCRYRPYYFFADFRRTIRENRPLFVCFVFAILFGVAIGIYFGIKTDPKEEINGIIFLLFRAEFSPFSIIWNYLLRYLIYLSILYIGGVFLSPPLFFFIATSLFGKYMAQISTVIIFTDSLLWAVLSILLVCLPLLLVGSVLLFLFAVYLSSFPAAYGAQCLRKTIAASCRYFLATLAVYFLLLILLIFVLCGVLRLLFVSV